jgi:hypothetical protein
MRSGIKHSRANCFLFNTFSRIPNYVFNYAQVEKSRFSVCPQGTRVFQPI